MSKIFYVKYVHFGLTLNSGDQVYISDEGSDPNFYYCDIQGGSTAFDMNGNFYSGAYNNNIDLNPQFVLPTAGSGTSYSNAGADWSLQNVSPCINTGNPTGTYPATDLAGNPRVYGSIIDIGAYEYQSSVGIKQLSIENTQVNIYPNPTNGSFIIESNSSAKQTLQVYNVNGKVVLTQTLNGKTNIDCSTLSEGVYNISLISSEGVANKRLVIVK